MATLEPPTLTEPKLSELGAIVTGIVPIPVSASVCVEPRLPESSVMFKAPAAGPAVTGVKVTEMVQFVAGISIAGQLLVAEKGPVAESCRLCSGCPPKLVTVIVCAGLVVPTLCEKLNVVGEKMIAGGGGLGIRSGVAPQT